MKETNIVIAEATGRGEASLDHLPLQVSVRPPLNLSEDAAAEEVENAAETEEVLSPVIIETVLDETRYDVPIALRSLRPYHYPAGQEGDAPESYLRWTCRIISASGVKLERDRTQEEKEKAIRDEWELNQSGRAERAKAKRARYKFINSKNAPEVSGEEGPEDSADAEATDELVGPPDGMDGMSEDEKAIEIERRRKNDMLPPVTRRGHLLLPVPDVSNSSSKGKKPTKKIEPRFVKRPGKHFTAALTTSREQAEAGDAIHSKFLTGMIVEEGRRRLTVDRQQHLLRKAREKKMERMQERRNERQKLLFPKIEAAEE